MSEIKTELPKKTLRVIDDARKLGIADEVQIRNLMIRADFNAMKKSTNYTERITQLVKKYNIGLSSIEAALYARNRRKKVIINKDS